MAILMFSRTFAALLCVLAATGQMSVARADVPVASCSRTEPSGERTLCQEAVISAGVSEVWRLFTTSDGLRSWAAPIASIDARTGGVWEATYNPEGRIGDASNIRNRIIAAEPDHLLVMQVADTPPGFQHEAEARGVTTVIELAPIDGSHTRLRISMVGYHEGRASTRCTGSLNGETLIRCKSLSSA